MASIGEDLDIIGVLLENDGRYPEDPQAIELSSYKNIAGGRTFHIAYTTSDIFSRNDSPAVKDIIILWNKTRGLTDAGKEVLRRYKDAKNKR